MLLRLLNANAVILRLLLLDQLSTSNPPYTSSRPEGPTIRDLYGVLGNESGDEFDILPTRTSRSNPSDYPELDKYLLEDYSYRKVLIYYFNLFIIYYYLILTTYLRRNLSNTRNLELRIFLRQLFQLGDISSYSSYFSSFGNYLLYSGRYYYEEEK